MNHGHVTPNPDGSRARCGGPRLCSECSIEAAQKREKANPSDREACAFNCTGSYDGLVDQECKMCRGFLAGVAHARKDQEHLIREARAKECEDMAKEATEHTLEADSLSYRASQIREGKG